MSEKEYSLEKLQEMEKMGFRLMGRIFKDTLTYQIIQRKKKEIKTKNKENE